MQSLLFKLNSIIDMSHMIKRFFIYAGIMLLINKQKIEEDLSFKNKKNVSSNNIFITN